MKRTSRIHDLRNLFTNCLPISCALVRKSPKESSTEKYLPLRSPDRLYSPAIMGGQMGCCCFCCCCCEIKFPFGRPQQQREANERATHQMCFVSRVADMFHCSSNYTQLFGAPVMEFDDEPPPMSSPKLTRCDETSPTSATAAARSMSTSTGGMGLGMEPALPSLENLKPRDFRRKDPALHFLAGIQGDTEELEKWLLAGGDPNARDGEGWALLHHASVSLDR